MAPTSRTKSPPFQLHLHNLEGTLDSLMVVSGNDFQEVGRKEASLKPGCHLLAACHVHSGSVPSGPPLLDCVTAPHPSQFPLQP